MYSPEERARIIPQVLEHMESGLSLRQSCVQASIPKRTFLDWVRDDAELFAQYTRAREAMLDAQAEELEAIGDEAASADTAVKVAGLRLKADNRKWLLSKLAPKKYGDRLDLGNADGESFKLSVIERVVVDPK